MPAVPVSRWPREEETRGERHPREGNGRGRRGAAARQGTPGVTSRKKLGRGKEGANLTESMGRTAPPTPGLGLLAPRTAREYISAGPSHRSAVLSWGGPRKLAQWEEGSKASLTAVPPRANLSGADLARGFFPAP